MAQLLKTNTAVMLSVGPFLDKTDGVTAETALTVSNCKITLIAETDDNSAPTLVLDNVAGNDATNTLAHISGDDAGYYSLKLTAANLNRLGRLRLTIQDAANHCPVFHDYIVVPAMVYDSLVGGTDYLQVDQAQLLGTAPTEGAGGRLAAGMTKLWDVATPVLTAASVNQTGDAYAIVNNGTYGNAQLVRSTTPANTLTVDAAHLVAVPSTQKVDVETIKTQAVTCGAGVTVGAYVGQATAALVVNASGHVTLANGAHGGAGASLTLGGGATVNITGSLSGSVGSVTAAVVLPTGTGAGQISLTSGGVLVNDYASGKAPLQPTTAGRTLDVAATGEAGLDFDNLKAASTPTTLTNITVPTVTTTATATALGAAYDAAKSAAAPGAAMTLTAAYDAAKTAAAAGAKMDLIDAPNATALGAIRTEMEKSGSSLAELLTRVPDQTMPTGAVVTDAGNTASSFKTDRTEAVADYWKDALLVFVTGNLAGQVKKVTAYNGTTKVITTGAFTGAPAGSDAFILVNR